jgi:hypothetical protein
VTLPGNREAVEVIQFDGGVGPWELASVGLAVRRRQ